MNWRVRIGGALPPAALAFARRAHREIRAWTHASLAPVVQISVPKSGTHLLRNALAGLGYRLAGHDRAGEAVRARAGERPDWRPIATASLAGLRPGEFATEHWPHDAEVEAELRARGFRVVFLYRDPRAVCVSYAHYAADRHSILGPAFRAMAGTDERAIAVAEGAARSWPFDAPLAECLERFSPWREAPGTLALRFEDLIGGRGGGSDAARAESLARLADFLGVARSVADVERIGGAIFDERSATFRRGEIAGWRDELGEDARRVVEERLNGIAATWGYGD